MIERYTRPQMGRIWSDQNKFDRWPQVEIPICEAWGHLGLTAYCVEDAALALRLMEATELLEEDLRQLLAVVEQRALEHKETLMMGRTHGVHAEPISFGLVLAQWADELRRQEHRLTHAKEAIAVGKISGAG